MGCFGWVKPVQNNPAPFYEDSIFFSSYIRKMGIKVLRNLATTWLLLQVIFLYGYNLTGNPTIYSPEAFFTRNI